jgi:hypothetical protein
MEDIPGTSKRLQSQKGGSMMQELIGTRVLGGVAGDIEALLSENATKINNAYNNIGRGTKISIGVSFKPHPKGVEFDIKLSFAPYKVEQPEKIKASVKRVMQENQTEIPLKVYKLEKG